MSQILQSVLSSLDPAAVQGMARHIGASPQETSRAIDGALPLLIGQLSRNAARPEGAQALLGAAMKDHSGVDLGSLLGGLSGAGAGSGAGSGMGGAILGHVFGNRQQQVASGLGAASGISGSQAMQLMGLLAPMVMAAIGRLGKAGADAGGVAEALAADDRQVRSQGGSPLEGMLGALLDSDGDGRPDLGNLGQAAAVLGSLFGRR